MPVVMHLVGYAGTGLDTGIYDEVRAVCWPVAACWLPLLLVDREVADLAANLISLPLCCRRSMSGSARSRI